MYLMQSRETSDPASGELLRIRRGDYVTSCIADSAEAEKKRFAPAENT